MDEINDIGNVIANTIDNKGEDKRNFFGILRAQRGATDLYNISGDSLNLLNEAYKSNKIGADEYKEGLRNIIEATGNDLGLNVSLVYLDTSTMPKDSEGSTGSSYIVDRKNRKVLIPIDVNKIEDIKELLGTLTEEVAHGKDALEGRQDKKVAEDKSNDEEGLESLGRPANEYVKKKFGEDNNSKIKLTTDGIDLSNADVGEKVGNVVNENYEIATFSSAGIDSAGVGLIGIGGLSLSSENNEYIKKVTIEVKEKLSKFGNNIKISYVVAKTLIEEKLREKGIIAEVKIDKDGNVMYTLSPLPEEEKNPRIPPMDPPKQETWKERWEREERDRREQKEKDNELQKPNGIPLQQEKPATIYYVEKTKEEKRVKSKGEILEEIKKADKKLDEQEGIKKQNRNFKKRRVYETKEGYIIYADDFHSKVEYEVFNKKGKHIGTISAKTIIKKGFHKEDIDTSKKDPKKRIDK